MAKARRMMTENLRLIDAVIEVIDARAPLSTRNPDFDDLFSAKRRVLVLNKSDLADADATKRWISYYEKRGMTAFALNSIKKGGAAIAKAALEKATADIIESWKAKGANKTIRAMVAGIPNVGKSAFINCFAGAVRAKTGDRPGVTKGRQWVKIGPYLELMDTPGVLWPKLDDAEGAKHLAFLGSINDDTMVPEELCSMLLEKLLRIAPESISERYGIAADGGGYSMLENICRSRGFLIKGGELDYERGARIILDEFRGGKLGRVTLESTEIACGSGIENG